MSNTAVFIPESCPYLGLHDDPRTSLAYPSVWNYCYRADPPASVIPSHQVTTCINREYVNCPVYLAEAGKALPSGLHGRLKVPAQLRSREGAEIESCCLAHRAGRTSDPDCLAGDSFPSPIGAASLHARPGRHFDGGSPPPLPAPDGPTPHRSSQLTQLRPSHHLRWPSLPRWCPERVDTPWMHRLGWIFSL